MTHPEKQIRAYYNSNTIRVYQAYSDAIANAAVQNNSLISPAFKLTRMTWIKPSFLWMMYRAGWGYKDEGQKRILAIDISHGGLHWALEHSCLSSFKEAQFLNYANWQQQKENAPVRIQWDPERDLLLNKLEYRAIQIGLSGEAVTRYTQDWIVKITDITAQAQQIKSMIDRGELEQARRLLPEEQPYPLIPELARKIGITT